MSGEKPREIAVEVLGRRTERLFTEEILEQQLGAAALPPADRRLCQELVYGVTRWQATLDWLIARKTGNRPQKVTLQNLLRVGLYQIFWLERIPGHAAVHVAVELAKRRGFGPQAGFINAVLRGYLREVDATRALLAELKHSQPALGYSHPDWLVTRWQTRWGTARTAQLLAWNNTPPKTFARVNTLKIQADKLLPLWRDEDVEYDFVRHDWVEENLVFELKSHPPLHQLPSFQQGFFYVQDPSTLLAVGHLDPKPGEAVLDLCAAPGGKLSYIAQLMHNEGRVAANDTSPERLKLVAENCARLGVTCVQSVAPPNLSLKAEQLPKSSTPHSTFSTPRSFDRVLVDAPCSNTGVMRRRVDLRWRISLQEIERLRQIQRDLLEKAAAAVKPGGAIVYSTCSLEPEENVRLIEEFLSERAEFNRETERELLPWADGVDGAYVTRLRRAPGTVV